MEYFDRFVYSLLTTLIACFVVDGLFMLLIGKAPIRDTLRVLGKWIGRALRTSRKPIENESEEPLETSHKTSFHPGFDPCEYCRFCGCTTTYPYYGEYSAKDLPPVNLGRSAEAVSCPSCGAISIINHDFIENMHAMQDYDKMWVVFLSSFRVAITGIENEAHRCQALLEYGFLNAQDPSTSPDIREFVESMVNEAFTMQSDELPIDRFRTVCHIKTVDFINDVANGNGAYPGKMTSKE